MKILKSQAFVSFMPQRELAEFVNKNNIQREDIFLRGVQLQDQAN